MVFVNVIFGYIIINLLESLNSVNKDLNQEKLQSFEKEYKHTVSEDFREIRLNYNGAKPRLSCYKYQSVEFNLNYLFGFSERKEGRRFP